MYSVMIAEDEPRIRAGIRKHIPWREMGFQVVADAENGEKAMLRFQDHRPDVILTDIRMEAMDGLKLMQEIRKCCSKTKFVVLSGYHEFEYARESMHYGASAYLLKPTKTFEFRKVFKKIKMELDEQHTESERQFRYAPKPEPYSDLQRALNYVKNHYCDPISLNEAAQQAFMSKSYFSKMFKQQVGRTFIEYVIDLRIEKAKKMLMHTDMKVIEIAMMVGYSDYRHFCKTFKNTVGCSPKSFRDQSNGVVET